MPELPDLEVYSINLKKQLIGKKIIDIQIHSEKVEFDPTELKNAIKNSTLQNVKREGKELYFYFSNDNVLAVHLRWFGFYELVKDNSKIKGKLLTFIFNEGKNLVIIAHPSFAKFRINPPLSSIPDALGSEFTLVYLKNQLKTKTRKNIKAFLIDQNILRGIGNAYADEILWQARISPESKCGKIAEHAIEKLYKAIKFVLQDAIKQIQIIEPNLIKGEIRSFLKVHGASKKYSPTGCPIIQKKIIGKYTYFTKEQILYN